VRRPLSTSHCGEDLELRTSSNGLGDAAPGLGVLESAGNRQRQFFEFPGPLFSVAISPASVTYFAPEEPGLARVRVTVRQRDVVCLNEALITVTNELLAQINAATAPARGLPGYTFERAPGESWRSKFDTRRNLIVVNNGHRDFVYASRAKSLKLRYLVRLYAKLVLYNFAGLPTEHLLERMVELSLRTEEHL